jgi:hypothetical protein
VIVIGSRNTGATRKPAGSIQRVDLGLQLIGILGRRAAQDQMLCAQRGTTARYGLVYRGSRDARRLVVEIVREKDMNAEKRQAGVLDAATRHFRRGELLAQKAEARLKSLIPDLLHLLERGFKGLETFRGDRKCIQLHSETDPRRHVAGLRKSSA